MWRTLFCAPSHTRVQSAFAKAYTKKNYAASSYVQNEHQEPRRCIVSVKKTVTNKEEEWHQGCGQCGVSLRVSS